MNGASLLLVLMLLCAVYLSIPHNTTSSVTLVAPDWAEDFVTASVDQNTHSAVFVQTVAGNKVATVGLGADNVDEETFINGLVMGDVVRTNSKDGKSGWQKVSW